MLSRRLKLPARSFLLLGPRGTGKTTWLRSKLPKARWYNLLLDREVFRLMREPAVFRQEIDALPRGSWVAIDEVQKLPSLLNDVHDVLSLSPQRLRFALTGSSARRLRREDINLLAGRVVTRRLLPLTVSEMGRKPSAEELLRHGALPIVRTARSSAERIDLLEAYAVTYLAQEIRAEALVRNLESFTRFLSIAALANGQVTNVAGIARDAAISRPTVQSWFEVLTDTLLGTWLPAWRPRAKIKEIAHPKFYLFDPGIVRALAGRLHEPLDSAERGPLLETLVFHELQAHVAYSGCGGDLSYYRTPSGTEIDFIWTRGRQAVGIEVKAAARWRSEDGRALADMRTSGFLTRGVGVNLGASPLKDGNIDVLPLADFLSRLSAGEIIG